MGKQKRNRKPRELRANSKLSPHEHEAEQQRLVSRPYRHAYIRQCISVDLSASASFTKMKQRLRKSIEELLQKIRNTYLLIGFWGGLFTILSRVLLAFHLELENKIAGILAGVLVISYCIKLVRLSLRLRDNKKVLEALMSLRLLFILYSTVYSCYMLWQVQVLQ